MFKKQYNMPNFQYNYKKDKNNKQYKCKSK